MTKYKQVYKEPNILSNSEGNIWWQNVFYKAFKTYTLLFIIQMGLYAHSFQQ